MYLFLLHFNFGFLVLFWTSLAPKWESCNFGGNFWQKCDLRLAEPSGSLALLCCRRLPKVWILVLLNSTFETVNNQSQQIDGSEEGKPGHKSLIQCQRWQKRAPLKSSSHWRNSVIGDVWTKVHGRKILNSTWRDEERDEDWDSLLCFTPWSRLILCTFYHKSKHIILNASQNLSGALSWNRILRTWPPHLDLSIRTLPKVKC